MIALLCWVSLSQIVYGSPSAQAKFWRKIALSKAEVCLTVAKMAEGKRRLELELIALSFQESKHSEKKSNKGAVSALQVMMKHWGRGRGEEPLKAALRAWKYYRGKYSDLQTAVGRYNGGGRHTQYAKDFMKHYKTLRDISWVVDTLLH